MCPVRSGTIALPMHTLDTWLMQYVIDVILHIYTCVGRRAVSLGDLVCATQISWQALDESSLSVVFVLECQLRISEVWLVFDRS